jgi:hypothetical protein
MAIKGVPLALVIVLSFIFVALLISFVWGIVALARSGVDEPAHTMIRNLSYFNNVSSIILLLMFIAFVALLITGGATAIIRLFRSKSSAKSADTLSRDHDTDASAAQYNRVPDTDGGGGGGGDNNDKDDDDVGTFIEQAQRVVKSNPKLTTYARRAGSTVASQFSERKRRLPKRDEPDKDVDD